MGLSLWCWFENGRSRSYESLFSTGVSSLASWRLVAALFGGVDGVVIAADDVGGRPCCYALTIGRYTISMPDLWQVLSGQGSAVQERIVWNIRLPRIVTAVFVGAALGVSGGIFQSVSRNALGSPDVIGFTTGAATGAIAQIVLFEQGPVQVALAAIFGGIVTAVMVYLLSRKAGVVGGYRLILTGIGIGAVLSALNGLMLVKGNIDNAVTANLWLAGSLHARTWSHAIPVMVGVIVLVPLIMLLARQLSLMEMGDDLATQLGIRVERVRLVMLLRR